MAGVIIEDANLPNIENDINALKRRIWSGRPNPEDIVLHQMRISEAERGKLNATMFPEYVQFSKNSARKLFYKELKKVFDNNSITILGACISENKIKDLYSVSGRNKQDVYIIALQLILENYCHFLCLKNVKGGVLYESRNVVDDESLRNKYYHLKLMGSMYMPEATTKKYLLGIDFKQKEENNVGLQIADFIPNSFARDSVGSSQLNNIFSTLKYHRYDGGKSLPDRFGVKKMP